MAGDQLKRRDDGEHADGHAQGHARLRLAAILQQTPGAGRRHHQGRRQIGRQAHMNEPRREGRREDHRHPVSGAQATVRQLHETRRVLHPAVGRDDPEGRGQGAHRHQHRGGEMQSRSDPLPAEQHHAQEAGLEEEGCQHLERQQRPDHRRGRLGELGPVRAELVAHHHAGDDAHAEAEGEDLDPEHIEVAEHLAAGGKPEPLQHREEAGQADGEARKDDVECNREGELQPCQKLCFHLFALPLSAVAELPNARNVRATSRVPATSGRSLRPSTCK